MYLVLFNRQPGALLHMSFALPVQPLLPALWRPWAGDGHGRIVPQQGAQLQCPRLPRCKAQGAVLPQVRAQHCGLHAVCGGGVEGGTASELGAGAAW